MYKRILVYNGGFVPIVKMANSAVQNLQLERQLSDYFSGKQILPFIFADQIYQQHILFYNLAITVLHSVVA